MTIAILHTNEEFEMLFLILFFWLLFGTTVFVGTVAPLMPIVLFMFLVFVTADYSFEMSSGSKKRYYLVFGDVIIPTYKSFYKDAKNHPEEFEVILRAMSPGYTGKFEISEEDGDKYIVVDMSGIEKLIPVSPQPQQ